MADALELAKRLAEKAQVKEQTVKVSRQFLKNFETVAAHYRCDPEEILEMKAAVKKDLKAAETSFSIMAKEVE